MRVNIYIFGSKKFNQNIYKILDHGNIKFKIGDGFIEQINSADTIKEQIMEDPTQIFLIDQNKIIYDDYLSKKLKFLQPKDGISKKFLDEYGMGDVSDKAEEDIVVYIEKRLEAMDKLRPKVKAEDLQSIEEMFEQYD